MVSDRAATRNPIEQRNRAHAHAAGEWTGTEFARSRWYPDVLLDNIFFHDHVDGIHNWGHGLVGQLIIEPAGSTWHDPKTGELVDSGTIVDIHTNPQTPNYTPLQKGLVDGSFREVAQWTINQNPITDATINLKAEPFSDRPGDPANRFSSYTYGDPYTPLPKAYKGDPLVFRTINVNDTVDTLHIDGHQFLLENNYYPLTDGDSPAVHTDTIHYGISERYTLILEGGAGGKGGQSGDYLYANGIDRRFRQGAWGLIRVLDNKTTDLQPLPDRVAPPAGPGVPSPTGGAPPAAVDSGAVCPAGSKVHAFAISAVDLSGKNNFGSNNLRAAFVPDTQVAAVASGKLTPEPLVLHVAKEECVKVTLTNRRALARVSFHASELVRSTASSGINVGFNPENTVAPGGKRTYVLYAQNDRTGAAIVSDFGGNDTGKTGLYGAIVVAPANATFAPNSGSGPGDIGTQVIVKIPGQPSYRDLSVILSDDDSDIGQSHMPYPTDVRQPALVNYQSVATQQRTIGPNQFSSYTYGDPNTPILRAYGGDPTFVHVIVAPGSEQMHTFNFGGMSAPDDAYVVNTTAIQTKAVGPWETFDAKIIGGAGEAGHAASDYFYGDLRRPFTDGGMWGLFRVLSDPSCPITPLDNRGCIGS